MGDVHWELTICLLFAWILLYGTIRKSVRWSGSYLFIVLTNRFLIFFFPNQIDGNLGKAVYLTATLPYVLLLALTARALTLEGADDGLRYFFYPDWSLLLRAEVIFSIITLCKKIRSYN